MPNTKRTQLLHGVWDWATKGQISQGPRVFTRSKATCAAPFFNECEVPSPCRGPRPHHAQTDRVGSWEIPPLAVSVAWEGRSASGRRGAVADDARTREVEPCHSSEETGEQSRPGNGICGGVDGAKGRGRGECEPACTYRTQSRVRVVLAG